MKQVDTGEYVSMLRRLTEEGHEVSLPIAGNSMSPFLVHRRDTIYFRKPQRPLKVGDMVFYQRENGQFVMHRICRIKNGGYYLIGDAHRDVEGPLDRERIFGLVTAVKRKGKLLKPGDFRWEFFARIWIRCIPLRGFLWKAYAKLS